MIIGAYGRAVKFIICRGAQRSFESYCYISKFCQSHFLVTSLLREKRRIQVPLERMGTCWNKVGCFLCSRQKQDNKLKSQCFPLRNKQTALQR